MQRSINYGDDYIMHRFVENPHDRMNRLVRCLNPLVNFHRDVSFISDIKYIIKNR